MKAKSIRIFKCQNLECQAIGRIAGKLYLDGTKTTDAQETTKFAEQNNCLFCDSKLVSENLDISDLS